MHRHTTHTQTHTCSCMRACAHTYTHTHRGTHMHMYTESEDRVKTAVFQNSLPWLQSLLPVFSGQSTQVNVVHPSLHLPAHTQTHTHRVVSITQTQSEHLTPTCNPPFTLTHLLGRYIVSLVQPTPISGNSHPKLATHGTED